MPHERHYSQRASAETVLTPAEVFAVLADLERLPLWWFLDDPDSAVWDGTRVVREVDGAGTIARTGISVEVVSSGAKNLLFGRRVWTEHPSVVRFTCETVEPDARLRLTHRPVRGDLGDHQLATEVVVEGDRRGSRVTLTQETVARGRGPGAWMARWAQARFDRLQRSTLRDLLAVAEDRAPGPLRP